MWQYVVDRGWSETYWHADPTGRAGQPHPLVALGILVSSALLVALVAFGPAA